MTALLIAVTGCSAGGRDDGAAPSTRPPASTTGPAGPDGAPGCRPASPVAPYGAADFADGMPEVRGTGHGLQAWGLMMPQKRYPPLRAGQVLKIVWRVTGTGPLRLTASDPGGREHDVSWGPEAHGDSSFKRPGDEWGAGYRLGEPGCWRLRLARGAATADVWLRVAA